MRFIPEYFQIIILRNIYCKICQLTFIVENISTKNEKWLRDNFNHPFYLKISFNFPYTNFNHKIY